MGGGKAFDTIGFPLSNVMHALFSDMGGWEMGKGTHLKLPNVPVKKKMKKNYNTQATGWFKQTTSEEKKS